MPRVSYHPRFEAIKDSGEIDIAVIHLDDDVWADVPARALDSRFADVLVSESLECYGAGSDGIVRHGEFTVSHSLGPTLEKVFDMNVGSINDPYIVGGDSGGPCLTSGGAVAAVLVRSAKSSETAGFKNVVQAIPASTFRDWYNWVHGSLLDVNVDINNDGLVDALILRETFAGSGLVTMTLFDGTLSRTFTMGIPGTYNVDAAKKLTSGDFNGDGARDVAGFMDGNSFYLGTLSGADPFLLGNLVPDLSFGFLRTDYDSLPVGDYNGDGFDDVLAFSPDDSIDFYPGSPTGLVPASGTVEPRNVGLLDGLDLNEDGLEDFAVGAVGSSGTPGAVYVVYGGSVVSPQAIGENDYVDASGDDAYAQDFFSSFGFSRVFRRSTNRFGNALSWGRRRGNGVGDFLYIGVPNAAYQKTDMTELKSVGVVAMAANDDADQPLIEKGILLNTPVAFETFVFGGEERNWFGASLAAGDFDGDGIDDIVVGAPGGAHPIYGGSGPDFVLIQPGSEGGDATPHAPPGVDSERRLPISPSWALPPTVKLERTLVAGSLLRKACEDDPSEGSPCALRENESPEDWHWSANVRGFGSSLAVGDFDCDGFDDLAVGVPGATAKRDEVFEGFGAVVVYYGLQGFYDPTCGDATDCGPGESCIEDHCAVPGDPAPSYEVLTHGSTTGRSELFDATNNPGGVKSPGEGFGATLTAANFNGDFVNGHACADLVIGVPRRVELVDGERVAVGELVVAYGSPDGLSGGAQVLSEGDWFNEVDAGFTDSRNELGRSLSVTNANHDGYPDLVAGVPGHGGGAGGFLVFPGSQSGLRPAGDVLRQGTGTADGPETPVLCNAYAPPPEDLPPDEEPPEPECVSYTPYLGGVGDRFGQAVGGTASGATPVGAPAEDDGASGHVFDEAGDVLSEGTGTESLTQDQGAIVMVAFESGLPLQVSASRVRRQGDLPGSNLTRRFLGHSFTSPRNSGPVDTTPGVNVPALPAGVETMSIPGFDFGSFEEELRPWLNELGESGHDTDRFTHGFVSLHLEDVGRIRSDGFSQPVSEIEALSIGLDVMPLTEDVLGTLTLSVSDGAGNSVQLGSVNLSDLYHGTWSSVAFTPDSEGLEAWALASSLAGPSNEPVGLLSLAAPPALLIDYDIQGGGILIDNLRLQVGEAAPPWVAGSRYHAGDRVAFDGVTYEARRRHTARRWRTPARAKLLWKVPASLGIAEWQPRREYFLGSQVYYDDEMFESLHHHVAWRWWSPPTTRHLWKNLSTTEPQAWAPYQFYRADDLVTHAGDIYRCSHWHFAVPKFAPDQKPGLWVLE